MILRSSSRTKSPSPRPSPALIVGILALVTAFAGAAMASDPVASTSALSKKKVKKIADKQITARAPNLSVAHARSADSAASADTANSANAADTAAEAGNAGLLQGAGLNSIAAGDDAFIEQCNPTSGGPFIQCGGANGGAAVTPSRQAKVLTIYGWSWSDIAEPPNNPFVSLGTCRTTRNGAVTSGGITMGTLEDDTQGGIAHAAQPVVDVQGPLAPGTYRFGLQCQDNGNDMFFRDIRIAAIVMGTS
jgi:hypothetical protein